MVCGCSYAYSIGTTIKKNILASSLDSIRKSTLALSSLITAPPDNILAVSLALVICYPFNAFTSASSVSILVSASCNVFTNNGTSLDWSMLCEFIRSLPLASTFLSPTETPLGNSSPSFQTCIASFSPLIASGTMSDTSCAKKPSSVVFASAIKLNLQGFSCFNLAVASNE